LIAAGGVFWFDVVVDYQVARRGRPGAVGDVAAAVDECGAVAVAVEGDLAIGERPGPPDLAAVDDVVGPARQAPVSDGRAQGDVLAGG
jgi:hypothetical protein